MQDLQSIAREAADKIISTIGYEALGGWNDHVADEIRAVLEIAVWESSKTCTDLRTQLAKGDENPQVGTCCICGSAIWHKEARMTDERGTFHPICAQTQKAASLLRENTDLRTQLANREVDLRAETDFASNLSKENDQLKLQLEQARQVVSGFLGYGTCICYCGHPACKLCGITKAAEQWASNTARQAEGKV